MKFIDVVHVKDVTYEELHDLIDNYEDEDSNVRMVCHDKDWNEYAFIGADNTTGDCFMETFNDEKLAVLYAAGCLNDAYGLGFEISEGDVCEVKTIIYKGKVFI